MRTRANIDGTIGHLASRLGDVRCRWCGIAVAVVIALAAGACAGPNAEATRANDLSVTVEKLRVENALYARKIEELENRVFVLNTQLESRHAAVGPPVDAAAGLPRVRLRRDEPAVREEPPAKTLVSDDEVEFAGEAARITSKRPVLRLYGTQEAPSTAAGGPMVIEGERAGHGAAALALYNEALEHLRAGEHVEAVAGFRKFVGRYPDHDYADNAQYWLAECFYDRKDYAAAAREFRVVAERFPRGNKVPDALLKIGFASLAVGDSVSARQALQTLVKKFPQHESAALAQARLAEIGGAPSGRAGEDLQ